MYYVMHGESQYFTARGPKFKITDDRLEDIRVFDYDDEQKWPDAALDFEKRRVSHAGKNFNPHALVALEDERGRRDGKDTSPWFDDLDELIDDLELAVEQEDDSDDFLDMLEEDWDDDEWDDEDDLDDDMIRNPVIMLEDISDEEKRLITELAELERKEMEFHRNYAQKKIEPDVMKQYKKLMKKGAKLRDDLMDSDTGMIILEMEDVIEDMKTMAAQLLFMYVTERGPAETNGEEWSEDLYYAGANLYKHAIILQDLEEMNGEGHFITGSESDRELTLAGMAYAGDAGPDNSLVQGAEEMTALFLQDMGFDISTLTGAKAAQKWLESSQIKAAFQNGDLLKNIFDWKLDEDRRELMLKVVKARIEEKIKGWNE